jgi:hypothetical protein
VCDDFESSSTGPDPAKWTIDASRMVGTATVDSMGAHGSAKSLKVSGGYLKVDTKAGLFTGVASKFWVRVNMRFDIAQPADHVTYLMLTDAAKTGELRVGAQNLGMIWNYSTNDTILPDYNEAANSLKPTANEWHCFEFHFDSDTPALHVYMDGQESPQMLLDATATPGIDDRWLRDMADWQPTKGDVPPEGGRSHDRVPAEAGAAEEPAPVCITATSDPRYSRPTMPEDACDDGRAGIDKKLEE